MYENKFKTSITINNILTTQDPLLKRIINVDSIIERELTNNYFEALLSAITSQQLSGKVADVIWKRFDDFFNHELTPDKILATDDEALRALGLSYAKIKYLKNLAQAVRNKEVDLENIHQMSDAEVIETLVKVKGIGVWTAEMFLIFSLGREDVFSSGDGGLIRGVMWLYGLEEKPSRQQLLDISQKWKPYRTYASFYLWEVANKNLDKQKKV
jgi:DNA-3-methyladenine glycosylase II